MTLTVEEMKNYLRIDFEDDDSLLENFITAGKKQCMDILRTDEEADHHAMDLTLRALLFGSRKEGF